MPYANQLRRTTAPQPQNQAGWGWRSNNARSRDNTLTDPLAAVAYNFADTASFGLGDEGAGVIEGVGAALSGGSYSDTYHRRVAEARERLARSREERPLASGVGMLAGGLATAVGTGGVGALANAGRLGRAGLALANNPLARAAAGRGVGALGAQSILGAGYGAAAGGLYGAGAADGGNRGEGAMWGAGAGGALGLVSPTVFQGLGSRWAAARIPAGSAAGAVGGAILSPDDPMGGALRGAAAGAGLGAVGRPIVTNTMNAFRNTNLTQRANAGVGMAGGQIFAGGAGAPRPPPVPEGVARRIDTLVGRGRYGADEFERRIGAARAEPMDDQRLVDVGGRAFDVEADTITQLPGQTGEDAATIARGRATAMPQAIENEMRTDLGISDTPEEALSRIQAMAANNSDGYERVLGAPVRQEGLQQVARLTRRARFQPVLARRAEIERDLIEAGRLAPAARSVGQNADGRYELAPENVTGRVLHELKVNVDDAFQAATDPRTLNAAGKSERRLVLDPFRDEFLDALDAAIPGYAGVRATAGGLYEGEHALEVGRSLLNMRPSAIARRVERNARDSGPASPFERRMYQIAVADEVLKRVWRRASASPDKVRNAGEALDSVEMQNALRAAFGEDMGAQVERFLARTNERGEMLRRAAGWTGNSKTAQRLANTGDRMMSVVAGMGARAAQGDALGAASDAGRLGWQALLGRKLEQDNNAVGQTLFRRLSGSPEDDAFLDALVREIRKFEQDRVRRALAAPAEGASSGVGGGSIAPEETYGY